MGPARGAHADREHVVRIYSPPGFTRTASYPVLYLFDGQNLFDRGDPAVTPAWGVDVAMDRLIDERAIDPWIVVGIDHAGAGRLAEYALWNEPRAGVLANGDRFATFMTDDLPRWVARHFPIERESSRTAIGGSSMGGLMSLSLAARAPTRFGRVLAMSPSVMWRDDAILELWQTRPAPAPRVYLDAGAHERYRAGSWSLDYGAAVSSFAKHLRQRLGYGDDELQVVLDPKGQHHESDWRRRLPDALRWLLR
jgi:predicted alpha/beta superfamily hydrolase